MPLTTEKMLHVKIVNLTTRPKLISQSSDLIHFGRVVGLAIFTCNIFSVVKGIAKYAETYRILIHYLNPVKSRKKTILI